MAGHSKYYEFTTETKTPVYTITYSDGTTETERGESTSTESTSYETETVNRQEVIDAVRVEVKAVIRYESYDVTVVGEAVTETVHEDSSATEYNYDEYTETTTVTRIYTDTITTPTTVTTYTTPIYTR